MKGLLIMVDRSKASRALAKVIAYGQCGKPESEREWLGALLDELGHGDLLPMVPRPSDA